MGWLLAAAALVTVAALLGVVYRPLGEYMAWVYTSPRDWAVERVLYRLVGVDPRGGQSWRAYLRAVLAFSAVGLVALYLLQRLQHRLPYSLGLAAPSPDLSFNTAASFVANTNWQSYAPERTVGYPVQMAGLGVQNFLSAAVGMAVAIALVRGFAHRRSGTIGNFWTDLVRGTVRILLPAAALCSVVLLAGGVVQNFAGFTHVTDLAGGGQSIPGGPVASQEAIKMLGTNGGGFFNANSAHPFENPSPWTNLFEIFLLLVIPFALPRTFGSIVRDHRLGYAILAAMAVLFVLSFTLMTAFEFAGGGTAPTLAGGAMEGKEQRFGVVGSTLFATATTGTSGGAANSTHGSYTALGGLVAMLNMLLGEVSPGGVGAGLYTILVMAIIAVFLTGLLLGRAPTVLGKRVGVREIKLASLFILVMPTLALVGMAVSLAVPAVHEQIVNDSMGNPGAHGVSEVMYAFISAAINNGSSFAGLNADTPWLNTTLGVTILLGRFVPIALVLALAGSLAAQDRIPATSLALPVHRPQFVGLLVGIIIFVSLPTFFPILTLGPLAEGLR
ncbi:potassium-transporting ATPase subunit KdpA [Rhizomonospora bruguierae]|uniref:potassium-transporting ATPase subunit KdpA n=1 Tax=Rhizomonospora bruguierae TaxID=1581705 RepID=UPI001BCA8FA5|nr:potassium-transporting ATPase subunit KdpA [Micromonospora sp. NBRC 107566]